MPLSLEGSGISFRGLSYQTSTNRVTLNNRNVFSHSLRVWKFEIKVLAGPRAL